MKRTAPRAAPDAVGGSDRSEPTAFDAALRGGVATDALSALLATAAQTAAADDAAVLRIVGRSVVVEASLGRLPSGEPLKLDEALRRAMQTGRAAEVGGRAWPATDPGASSVNRPPGRMLVVPLRVDGASAGLLTLRRRKDRPYDPGEVDAVERLGVIAAFLLRETELLREARAAERAAKDRVNMVVHELRSPMAVIHGYLTMLQEGSVGALPKRAAPLLAMLVDQAAKLATIINETLSAAERAGLHAQRITCVDLLGRALARSSGHAALVGASLVCDAPGDLAVLAHRESVDRILDNLVANALVHAGPAPTVALQARADAGAVAIRVRDKGPGVPDEIRDAVFERFVRGTDGTEGSGLGLYISKGLARMMGGDLVLEAPASGSGATFDLRLPAAG